MSAPCYRCAYRLDVPMSAHSRCVHPEVAPIVMSPMGLFISLLPDVGGQVPALGITPQFELRYDDHGARNGWFFWPFNFDPVWLDECGGFTPADDDS